MFLILSPRSLGFSNAEAAIDDVDLTCSKAGFVGGQIHGQGSDLFRTTYPSHWLPRDKGSQSLFRVTLGGDALLE